jgi:hypothetical protein
MKRTLAALAIATLTGVSAVAIAPAFAKPDAAAEATSKGGDRGEMKRGPHGGKHAGKHEGRGDHKRGHGPHGPRNMQMWLASNLSTTETLIGITADQQDAWRGYTNALLAMFERPARPDAKPGDDTAKVPFAREERLIKNSTERATKAAALQTAIDALKAKLTPEQLQKLADAELRFGPPMRGHGHGHGPDRGPGHGPRGEAPQAGPDGADAPDMPDDDAPQAE